MCLSHSIYTVRPCLIHTYHAMPMPCSNNAVLLKATAQHDRLSTAVLCCGLEKNDMVGAWHGKCESDMAVLCKSNGKDTFQTLGGRAWARYGNGMLCVNRPLNVRNVEVKGPLLTGTFSLTHVFVGNNMLTFCRSLL